MTQNKDITKACFMFGIPYSFMAHVSIQLQLHP